MGTGGGPFLTPKTSTVDEDIREILGSQVTGMQSNFDNDLDENVLINVPKLGIQSEVMFESDNEDNIEYYEIETEESTSGNLKESLREIAPKPGILKELVDNNYSNTGYEELEEHEGGENDDSFVCDENASFHEVETPISQCRSTQSEKTQNNYNTESQWKMLNKPISKVLIPNSQNITTPHGKPLLRPLQSQKSEAEEKSKKRGRPDPLKQKLGKWAESKSNLVGFQNILKKKCIRASVHEARMMKILGPQ